MANRRQRQLQCWAVAAKRYVLFERLPTHAIEFAKDPSEHGLGHLLPPGEEGRTGWHREFWTRILGEESVIPIGSEPPGLNLPAISRTTVSCPAILRTFRYLNAAKAYGDRIGPFDFVMNGFVAPLGFPVGSNPRQIHLMAPFCTDPRAWVRAKWTNLHDAMSYRSTTRDPPPPGRVRLKTHRDMLAEYRAHPEAKSAGPNGEPCSRQTRGLLGRRAVTIAWVELIGKEANRLEDVENGLVHAAEDVQASYAHFDETDWKERVVPALRRLGLSKAARLLGVSRGHVTRVVNGRKGVSPALRSRLAGLTA